MASEAEDFGAEICDDTEEVYAMNAMADPVLGDVWDNEKDAEYDRI